MDNKKLKSSWAAAFTVASVWFGTHVGAGFATGNQVVNYFVQCCLRYVRCGGRRNRAAGEPEGARPASGAISRGNAEATTQASACGGVAVCGMLDAAGSPAAQMKCYIIRSARSGYRKNRPASYRTCGAVLCNVRFRLRAALTSSAT